MNPIHARIALAIESGALPATGVLNAVVEHGPGCRHHQNLARPCTCTPRVTVTTASAVLVIGTGGAILERSPLQ